MAKTNEIKKLVNGEIADADDVNQIAENVGSEGGSLPYSDDNQQRSTDGSESLGTINYPWGDLYMNQLSSIREIDTVSATEAASVTLANLRKFISQKDTPNSYSGKALQVPRVNAAEDALEFATGAAIEIFTTGGTWTCPAGVNYIKATIVGGGGGGGGGSTVASGSSEGGGGGEAIIGIVLDVTPGNTYSVTVGSAGSGGAAGNPGVDGTDGTLSSMVGDNYTATASPGLGGAGSGGSGEGLGGVGDATLDASTTTGGNHHSYTGGNGAVGTGGSGENGGGGGASYVGSGGDGGLSATGEDGQGIGAGGGGGGSNSAGGAGIQGIVIIEYSVNGAP